MLPNIITFEDDNIETSKGEGSISTLTFDIDVTIVPNVSNSPMAPTHRVFAPSPCGNPVECGGVWKKQNQETGEPYYTISIRCYGFDANLGQAAEQDDRRVQGVIPWGPQAKHAA